MELRSPVADNFPSVDNSKVIILTSNGTGQTWTTNLQEAIITVGSSDVIPLDASEDASRQPVATSSHHLPSIPRPLPLVPLTSSHSPPKAVMLSDGGSGVDPNEQAYFKLALVNPSPSTTPVICPTRTNDDSHKQQQLPVMSINGLTVESTTNHVSSTVSVVDSRPSSTATPYQMSSLPLLQPNILYSTVQADSDPHAPSPVVYVGVSDVGLGSQTTMVDSVSLQGQNCFSVSSSGQTIPIASVSSSDLSSKILPGEIHQSRRMPKFSSVSAPAVSKRDIQIQSPKKTSCGTQTPQANAKMMKAAALMKAKKAATTSTAMQRAPPRGADQTVSQPNILSASQINQLVEENQRLPTPALSNTPNSIYEALDISQNMQSSSVIQEKPAIASSLHLVNRHLASGVASKKQQQCNELVEEVSCFKCKLCSYLNMERSEVLSHVEREHRAAEYESDSEKESVGCMVPPEGTTRYTCAHCTKIFISMKSLMIHYKDKHPGEVYDYSEKNVTTAAKRRRTKGGKQQECETNFEAITSSNETSMLPSAKSNNETSQGLANSQREQPSLLAQALQGMRSPVKRSNLTSMVTAVTSDDDDSGDLEIIDSDIDRGGIDADGSKKAEEVYQEEVAVNVETPSRKGEPKKTNSSSFLSTDMVETALENLQYLNPLKNGVLNTIPSENHIDSVKKRGRPRGSKNLGITQLKKLCPDLKDKSIMEKEWGFKCDVHGCAVRMKESQNIEFHRRCHIGNEYRCTECGEDFSNWRNMSNHLWKIHVIDMELYSCDQCPFKTYSASKLEKLHKKIHSDERPYLCDMCGKGFKTTKQLRNHKSIHRRGRLPGGKYKAGMPECDVCHRRFSDFRMLRIHKDTVHMKKRPFLCNFCGYSASSSSTLKLHMRQHTGEKPFSCTMCSYKTSDHNSLRRHNMRHSGKKQYKCPHCSYACIQASTYKAHLKNKHPGQDEGLMYSCHLCRFRTVKKENFMSHVALHADPKQGETKGEEVECIADNNKDERGEMVQVSLVPSRGTPISYIPSHGTTLLFSSCDDFQSINYGTADPGDLSRHFICQVVPEGLEQHQMTGSHILPLVQDGQEIQVPVSIEDTRVAAGHLESDKSDELKFKIGINDILPLVQDGREIPVTPGLAGEIEDSRTAAAAAPPPNHLGATDDLKFKVTVS